MLPTQQSFIKYGVQKSLFPAVSKRFCSQNLQNSETPKKVENFFDLLTMTGNFVGGIGGLGGFAYAAHEGVNNARDSLSAKVTVGCTYGAIGGVLGFLGGAFLGLTWPVSGPLIGGTYLYARHVQQLEDEKYQKLGYKIEKG